MPAITIKKPRFIGVNAALIEANATLGKEFKNAATKAATARKAVADVYVGSDVVLVKVNGERFVVLDVADAYPDFADFEANAKIAWAGAKGEIIVAI